MLMPNPLKPDHLSPDERLAEVGRILALGAIRLRARQSKRLSANSGESCLDCPAPESGHGVVTRGTENAP